MWLAPEVMANKVYTTKADIYSIGVILWEILTRQAFFGEITFMSVLEDKVPFPFRPRDVRYCVLTLLRSKLAKDHRYQMTARRGTGS